MGNSMGGVTVLAEAVSDQRVRALILDSMHASALVSIGNGAEVENGLPSLPTSWAVVVGVAIRIGADWTVVDPVQTIARVGDRPVLLVHGTNDVLDRPAQSADRNFHAAMDAGVPVELEYCRGRHPRRGDRHVPRRLGSLGTSRSSTVRGTAAS